MAWTKTIGGGPMRGRMPVAVLCLVGVTLGGCELNRVVPKRSKDFKSATEVGYAFGGRDAWVKIDGNPFTIDQRRFDQTIIDIVAANWTREPANFTTTPGESANSAYKLVVVFNPTEGLDSETFCSNRRISTAAPTAQKVEAQMAFCRHSDLVNAARGFLYNLKGPGDPALQTVIGDMISTVFPRELIDRGNSRDGIELF